MRRTARNRGRHGLGSVFPLANGRWGYSLQRDGKRISGSKKTEAEAEATLEQLIAGVETVRRATGTDPTLSEFLDRWLAEIVRPHLRPNSVANYAQMVEQHIKPVLGHKHVSAIRRVDVQHLINTVMAKTSRRGAPLSPKTVKNVHGVLSCALHQALDWGMVPENVALRPKLPKRSRPTTDSYTEAERGRFLDAVKGNPYEAAFVLACVLGPRCTEILSLERRDVNLDTGELHLRGTKSEAASRTVIMPGSLARVFARHIAAWAEAKLAAGDRWQAGDRLFVSEKWKPLPRRTFAHHYERLIAKSGLRRLRFHDLRHTAATLMLLRGVPVQVVSEILGHSNVAMTLGIYTHVLQGQKHEAASRLEDVLEGF